MPSCDSYWDEQYKLYEERERLKVKLKEVKEALEEEQKTRNNNEKIKQEAEEEVRQAIKNEIRPEVEKRIREEELDDIREELRKELRNKTIVNAIRSINELWSRPRLVLDEEAARILFNKRRR